ncbi:unnamed protein product [Meloidogyne enterolobii]|uniref:Uncharacterized protein n=1 Tax=Meloidogyne enterolobii TaxID=390850 RepID=A0ACB1ATY3_MELEN
MRATQPLQKSKTLKPYNFSKWGSGEEKPGTTIRFRLRSTRWYNFYLKIFGHSSKCSLVSLGGHGAKGSYLNNVLIIRYDFLPFLPLSVSYKFLKIIIGSALSALEGKNPEIGEKSVFKLLETLDNYFKIPKREVTHETIFAVEKVYNIEGGVVTGKLEQGSVKKGDKLVIAGQGKNKTTIVNGLETFCKTVDKGEPGDQLGIRYFLFFLNWVFGDRLIFACGGSNKM